MTQISKTLKSVETLIEFSPNHKSCFHPSNGFLDDMANIAPRIRQQNLNSAVLHHFEKEDTKRFMIGLFRVGAQLTCKYSYSLAQINLLLSANPALVSNYLTRMSGMFHQNNNKRHGLSMRMGKDFHTPYTENFVLSTVGLETCACICKSRNSRFKHDKTLGHLIYRNKTVNNCQGWSYTKAWNTHKFITGMDYESQIGKVAVKGRPHCVSNMDSSEPRLQVNGTFVTSQKILWCFQKNELQVQIEIF